MAKKNDIRDAIRTLSDKGDALYSIVCKVKKVDLINNLCDCEPINGDADLLDVRLMAQSSTGFLIIPKLNSVVVVTMLNKYTGYVAMFSEVDEIQLNGGLNGGIVKATTLTTKLNILEADLNALKTAFSSWVIIPSDGGAALKAIATAWASASLVPTTPIELQNLKVKHG